MGRYPVDERGHAREHSIENQLPFLQHLAPSVARHVGSKSPLRKAQEELKKQCHPGAEYPAVIVHISQPCHPVPAFRSRLQVRIVPIGLSQLTLSEAEQLAQRYCGSHTARASKRAGRRSGVKAHPVQFCSVGCFQC